MASHSAALMPPPLSSHPIFRYFDTFVAIADLGAFAATPRVRSWRAALMAQKSVQEAVGPDYSEVLYAFLVRHDAYLLKLGRPI